MNFNLPCWLDAILDFVLRLLFSDELWWVFLPAVLVGTWRNSTLAFFAVFFALQGIHRAIHDVQNGVDRERRGP